MKAIPPRTQVMRRDEKEARLGEFIRHHVRSGGDGAREPLLLIARSPDSPVARAIVGASPVLAAAGMTVRAIFTTVEARELEAPWIADATTGGLLEAARIAANPRLLDAHECLVIGPAATWTGDSMRRDPSKRDAFECFSDECLVTCHRARRSFDELWARSESLFTRQRRAAPPSISGPHDDAAPPPGDGRESGDGETLALTRH